MGDDLKEKTAKTAKLYFDGYPDERPFDLWRSFDKKMAKDLSLFVTGTVYAREDPSPDTSAHNHSRTDRSLERGRAEAPHLWGPERGV